MLLGEDYEAERASQRKRTKKAISRIGDGFVGFQFLGFVAYCSSIFFRVQTFPTDTTVYLICAGIAFLLISLALAGWVGFITLRTFSLLSWYWRVLGLVPWGAICAESVVIIVIFAG